ncbi:uncharacterized protein LOC130736303 [Lotus japonicus]|uniref:uncharacterized protein LOC130736303 n=1 Tax=Lotus japonicus TaxID=34305 RepID=UPI00258B5F8F|nr:uncharacterized protein LOC130736303 [Lotus japonicus]
MSRPHTRKRAQDSDADAEKKPKKKTKKIKAETQDAKPHLTQSRAPWITRSSTKESSKPQTSAFIVNIDVIPSSSTQTLPPFTVPLIPKYPSLTTLIPSTSAISTSSIALTTTLEQHIPPPPKPDLLDQIRQASSAPTPQIIQLPFPNNPELPQTSSPMNTSSSEREFQKVLKERTSGPPDEILAPIPHTSPLFNPTPLNVVFPPLSSPESSQVSLSRYSPFNSTDFVFPNPEIQPILDQTTSDQVTQVKVDMGLGLSEKKENPSPLVMRGRGLHGM